MSVWDSYPVNSLLFITLTFITRLIKRDSASVGRRENHQLRTGNSSVGSESRTLKINFKTLSSDLKMYQEQAILLQDRKTRWEKNERISPKYRRIKNPLFSPYNDIDVNKIFV